MPQRRYGGFKRKDTEPLDLRSYTVDELRAGARGAYIAASLAAQDYWIARRRVDQLRAALQERGTDMGISSKDLEAMGYKIVGDQAVPIEGTPPKPKTSHRKYRNQPTVYDGIKYASRAEAARARQLDQLRAGGAIRAWERQPTFRLGVDEVRYRADFRVVDNEGNVWIEDVKGAETRKFKLIRKLWQRFGPHPLHIIKQGRTAEVIEPGE